MKVILLLCLAFGSAMAQSPFLASESQVRTTLNQYTFKRDVTLQTIGPNGVTGEYRRTSLFTFTDKGERVEKVLSQSKDTITEMRITREDLLDLAGAQMLGIDDPDKYDISLVEPERVEPTSQPEVIKITPAVYQATPRVAPNPQYMDQRYFRGLVWTKGNQIVRVRGVVEPSGKQRFPWFDTYRGEVGAPYLFPVRTEADDVLHFPERDVHYRISVRYYDYRRFGVEVTVKEAAQPRWPEGSEVKVYFTNQFTQAEVAAILRGVQSWPQRFTYAGIAGDIQHCEFCLTIERKDVQAADHNHAAFFYGWEGDGFLRFGWIDLDFKTVNLQALESYAAHETGHSLGLTDCRNCNSVMRDFPGVNKSNGYQGPTETDKVIKPY